MNQIFQMKTIAVVGMSPKPERPSHYVGIYLIKSGYDVIPVNPVHKEIAGIATYPSLLDIPNKVDVVNVFRRSEHTPFIAEAAIAVGAKALWLQDGVYNKEAKQIAEDAGLLVVMNDCILRRHSQISEC
tara:strand:+ start:1565 stop:1951 length:387 start_codon:yes stop_codon:yes gene_type:complete